MELDGRTLHDMCVSLPALHSHFVEEDSRTIIDSSKLQDYQACPRKFFFRHILGWDYDTPSYHLHFGKAWHAGLEHLYKYGFQAFNVGQAAEAFIDAYNTLDVVVPNKSYKTPERAIKAIFEYANKYVFDIKEYDILDVESPYTIPITEKRTIIVNRDVKMRKKGSDALVILEHKTAASLGRTFEQPWRLSVQIAMYAFSAYLEGSGGNIPMVIVNATSFKANGAEFARVPCLRSFTGLQNALFTVNGIWDDIERDLQRLYTIDLQADFLQAFRQSPQACANYSGCQYFDFCTCCGNPLNIQSPPLGMTIRFWNPAEAYT